MVSAALPDLDQLDAEALKALLIAGHNQLLEQRATLTALHAELDAHRQTLTAQSEQLRSSSERIEHLKLLVDRFALCPARRWERLEGRQDGRSKSLPSEWPTHIGTRDAS
jgi:hypothetical protein